MKEEISPRITYKVNLYPFNIRTMTEHNSTQNVVCVSFEK